MEKSSFFLTDITSLTEPSTLIKGDGNTFLNILVLILGALCFYGAKTNPKDKDKIIIVTVSFLYFIYFMNIKFGSTSEKSNVTSVEPMEEIDISVYERIKNGETTKHLFTQ